MYKVLLLILILSLGNSYSSQTKQDSLWNVWNNTNQADTNRLNSIKEFIINGYLYNNPDSSIIYTNIYYEFAKSKGLEKHMFSALNLKGISYYFQSKYDLAIKFYNQALVIQKSLNYQKGIAATLNNIGAVYYDQGDYKNALENWKNSLEYEEKINNQIGIASTYNNIGIIYHALSEDSIAIDYYNKSIDIQIKLNNKHGEANSLNNIGVIYLNDSIYDIALEYFKRSLKICEDIEATTDLTLSLHNIGSIYSNSNEFEKAEKYLNRCLIIQKKLKDQNGVASTYYSLGEVYNKKSNFKKAISYLNLSLNIALEIDATALLKEIYLKLSDSYNKTGNFKKAYEMQKLYIEKYKIIIQKENDKKIFIELERSKHKNEQKALQEKHSIEQQNKDEKHRLEDEKHFLEQENKDFQRTILFGVLGLTLLFTLFMYNRFRISNNQKNIIKKQKDQTDNAFDQLEIKNNEIMDSINYAKRIQSAILPQLKTLNKYLKNHFIYYQPKDIVAGDFYWLEASKATNGAILFAVADCTGHGVPGAMVSVICNNGLNRSVREHGITEPGKILDKTLEIITEEFEKSEDDVKDGMDIALCKIEGDLLSYAGAHNPLWIIRNNSNEIEEIPANKQSIGIYDHLQPFETKTAKLQKGDTVYLFTDGYIDQFGGERGKKYKSKKLKSFLIDIKDKSMEEQHQLLKKEFESWRGNLEQIDDVCIMGVRI
jgi:serine phosphatase RsbU (regulator of sigma subunit)